MQITDNFKIAIITDKIQDTQNISDNLKKMGLLPYYYQDTNDLWMDLDKGEINLLITDVQKMTEGEIELHTHPALNQGKIKTIFFYKADTQALLTSNIQTNCYGFINGDLDLEAQLKTLVQKVNNEMHFKDYVDDLKNKNLNLKKIQDRLAKNFSLKKRQLETYQYSEKVCNALTLYNAQEDFFERCIKFLYKWEAVKTFTIYTLNDNEDYLVPLAIKNEKGKELPRLALPTKQRGGISKLGSDMAQEVCHGILGERLRLIPILGSRKYPDAIIIGEFNEESIVDFQWGILELKISTLYLKWKLANTEQTTSSAQELSFEQVVSLLDIQQESKGFLNYTLANVSFNKLNKFIKNERNNIFQWTHFRDHLRLGLSQQLGESIEFSFNGIESLIVLFDKNYKKTELEKLKSFINNIEYWKFFENEVLLNSKVNPTVQIIRPLLSEIIIDTQAEHNPVSQSKIRPPSIPTMSQ